MISLFYPKFRNIPIVPPASREAYYEMLELNLDLDDVKEALEKGVDSQKSRRKKNIVERTYNHIHVVVELKVSRKGYAYWYVRHVSRI